MNHYSVALGIPTAVRSPFFQNLLTYRLGSCFLYSELRDQGLTRPKVVILVPFRDAALKVVEAMMQLVCPGDGVRPDASLLIAYKL